MSEKSAFPRAEKPILGRDIVCVSHARLEDGPVLPLSSRMRTPMPIPTWNSLRHIASYSENEVCGFIDSRWNPHFITNRHAQPGVNFYMDQHEVRKTIERIAVANDTVLGVFHTHPSGSTYPSQGDISGWPNRKLNWRYWIATAQDVYEYEWINQPPDGFGPAKYGY